MKSMRSRIVFFVPEWPASNSSVLESQVLVVAGFLSRRGVTCLFIGTDRSDPEARRTELHIQNTYGIQARIFGLYAARPNALNLGYTTYKAFTEARHLIKAFAPTHVYARSFMASMFGRHLAKENNAISIYDVRGVVSEECALAGPLRGVRSWIINLLESHEMTHAARLATVSEKLARHIDHQIGRACAVVIPSCYDPERFSVDRSWRKTMRREMRAGDKDRVLCYSGGTAPWQRIEEILVLFEQVAHLTQHVRFVVLTPDPDAFSGTIASSPHCDRYVVKSCPHHQVARYLSGCDAGIIMRYDTVVNNVASPIKVAEYLACGLPLVMTKGIGDYSDDLPKRDIGLLLDETADLAEQVIRFLARPDFDLLRACASRYAVEHLTLEANWSRYRYLYEIDSESHLERRRA